MMLDPLDITDPLSPEAQSLYPFISHVADQDPSIVVLEGYLWQKDDPVTHFGALCDVGAKLLLSPDPERGTSHSMIDAAIQRQGEDIDEVPSACPTCQRRANELLRNVFEAPLAHVRCCGDLITVVYTGSDEDMDGAFATLSQEGLVDLKRDWTELIRAATR